MFSLTSKHMPFIIITLINVSQLLGISKYNHKESAMQFPNPHITRLST